jgi:hypothetical protein
MVGLIMEKKFRYNSTSQMITDTMTGFTYQGNKAVCGLLNRESERADNTAEKYYELLEYNHSVEFELSKFRKVLKKYGISDVEKLDRVLLEQRVW